MTTLSQQVSLYLTDRRNRRRLIGYATAYSLDNYVMKSTTLAVGQSELVPFNKVFLAAFTRPTLIRISDTGGVTIEVTVNGIISLPMIGSLEIVNPSTATIQEPLTVTYIAG